MATSADLRNDPRPELTATARVAHAGSDWQASYAGFNAASALGPLDADDLAAMAAAAWRLGRLAESVRLSERVFTQYARRDPVAAGDKAVGLALAWLTRGDRNVGRTWMQRARELIGAAPATPTHGYLLYLEVVQAADAPAPDLDDRVRALEALGEELQSPTVTALALVAGARAALAGGRTERAQELLDAAERLARTGGLPIEWAGEVYGTVLRHSRRDVDVDRSAEWVDAMERWREQAGLAGVYRGWAAHSRGAVQVRTGEHRRALDSLAVALREYRTLQPSRDTADVYEWMMMAHRSLGDGAAAEDDAASASAILRLLAE